MQYPVHEIEKKWQQRWAAHNPAAMRAGYTQKKFYCLDMFPYPSGSGLHVGHWRGYVLSDVYARMKWREGYNVLHPMGWDAFGLPAENDAIKKGIHPVISTAKNIAHFKTQLAQIGAIYDWSKELNTTDPEYYRWTQWIFLVMFKRGLAYEAELPINWCPSCLTGLANEEVVDGACERCGAQVHQKNIRQWVLRITQYAERLLNDLDRLDWPEKVKAMQRHWIGKKISADGQVTYQLRDWVFSRQRYWGEPIPLVHCAQCGIVPVPEEQLPVRLPEVDRYEPTGTGESPLAGISEWVNTSCPQCTGSARRETNTMPQWAGSCWYFLRYPNPQLSTEAFSAADMQYWLPVDLYVGGIEHAILHLLYARFYVKVLHDAGYVPFDEPFLQLFNQGMVCKFSEKSGHVEKMSKSKGNVVNPDEIVTQYGSDALRLYMLFMGPPELDCEWQDNGIEGMKRFLQKIWGFFMAPERVLMGQDVEDSRVTRRVHRFLREFQERLAHVKPNTAVSGAMELFNDLVEWDSRLSRDSIQSILVSLSVIVPHIASELLETIVQLKLENCPWPVYDPALATPDTRAIAVQVNGKHRSTITVANDAVRETIETEGRKAVAQWLEKGTIERVIWVPGRLLNFVIQE